MKTYEALIIGAGQAGPSIAAAFAAKGEAVALAEGNLLGGSCVNYGCIPTKTLIASAKVAHIARRAAEYGISTGAVSVDFAAVMARVHARREAERGGLEEWLKSYPTLDILHAYAGFEGYADGVYQVRVGPDRIGARKVFINTGARAVFPALQGIDSVRVLDSAGLLDVERLPEHLIILGGSYIGIEMGQAFRRLGSRVTIIEHSASIMPREDDDIITEAARILTHEGIQLLTRHKAIRVAQAPDGEITVWLAGPDGAEVSVSGSHLLAAAGRAPNTERLNLPAVGIETYGRGYIRTDDHLRTAAPNVWAVGDVNGRGAFTHTSYQEHEIVLDNLNGGTRSVADRTLAYALYMDPPLGRVGLSERDVRESGRPALISVRYMKDIGRAKEQGETNGLMKLIVDAETERFLGAAIFGYQGDDSIQVISNYMATGASYHAMKDALPIHPTISEFLPTVLGALKPLV